MGKMIETNMGIMPVEDYLDIMAMQYGFDDYKDLREHGMILDCPEAETYEKEQREKISPQDLYMEDYEMEDR